MKIKNILLTKIWLLSICIQIGCTLSAFSQSPNLFEFIKKKDESLEKNFFTYVGQNPFHLQPTDGIILGQILYSGKGSIFSITKLDENNNLVGSPILLNLSYCVTNDPGGILPETKKVYKEETVDVFAGAIRQDRKEAFKPILGAKITLKGLNASDQKNIRGMKTQLPSGWFFFRLPEGNYQIIDMQGDEFAGIEFNSNSTTHYSDISSISRGPIFQVKNGVINYIGKYNYAKETNFSSDINEAKQVVSQGVSRIEVTDPQWNIVQTF